MPYMFFMILPMMMWDALMVPGSCEPARDGSRKEPWGKLTP
jgi:hypothetical protein